MYMYVGVFAVEQVFKMEKLRISGCNAFSFLLMTCASLLLFLSFESPFWAEVRTGCCDTRMAVGIWRYVHLAVDIPSDISQSALHGGCT